MSGPNRCPLKRASTERVTLLVITEGAGVGLPECANQPQFLTAHKRNREVGLTIPTASLMRVVMR